MSTIATRLQTIRSTFPQQDVELLAVSKFHPADAIIQAYSAGQRHFGESRVQELQIKAPALPDDIVWHFIGHLQTNKVRTAVQYAHIIESIDSDRVLMAVDREATLQRKPINVLMQVHVAAEETKTGFSPDELLKWFESRKFEKLQSTHICGLMAMATNTPDTRRVASDFKQVAELRNQILLQCPDLRGFDTLSMGMSHDYPIALAHGSTEIRIGTDIFGQR